MAEHARHGESFSNPHMNRRGGEQGYTGQVRVHTFKGAMGARCIPSSRPDPSSAVTLSAVITSGSIASITREVCAFIRKLPCLSKPDLFMK